MTVLMQLGPASHSFMSQRLKLNYHDYGNPDAPLLLLVHGGRDHSRSWDWIADDLGKDWHVVAPDLRGHGDSAWAPDGNYETLHFVYDLAQLVHHLGVTPVRIVAHSLGGGISLRFAGLYPELVERLVVVEGVTPPPMLVEPWLAMPVADRIRHWIGQKRAAASRLPKRYASFAEALDRMKAENSFLGDDQAHHLTLFGTNRNEDGTFSWKFDNHLNVLDPMELVGPHRRELWHRITCPVMLCHGEDSWGQSPLDDGSAACFSNPPLIRAFPNAGHWLHHDQPDLFLAELKGFL